AAGTLVLGRVTRALGHLEHATRETARKGVRRAAALDQRLTTAQLRALVAVASAHNFSLAARSIGISQPSLHRAARDLERLLELALFDRTSRGIVLTPAAELLAQHAKLAFAELAQGYAEVAQLRGIDCGRIVVGSMPLPRTHVLPAAINGFTRDHPDVLVSVVDGPYADLLHGLRHGDIDLLVGALRDPLPAADVTQERLFDDPLAVVARSGHPLAGRAEVGLDELLGYPWVVPRPGTPTRDQFERLLAAHGERRPPGLVEASSLVLIRGLLLGSDRLTLISSHQVRHECSQGLLAALPFADVGPSRPIGLTQRAEWKPTPTQQRFLACVRAAAALPEPPRAGRGYSNIE
ncbi:MAG TPA: LysR family transcriptional regulator, partial [Gammaproteobacteria bacterium]